MKKNLMTRIFKGALALLLAFSVVETSAFTKVSALDVVPNSKVADTDTSEEWRKHFINNTQTTGTVSTGNAGYVWSDKTVLTTPNAVLEEEGVQLSDEGNFLVELSAVSANREVVGYSTIPTDTMLVLDLSNSMTEDNMYAMVKAVNAAMDKLLKLNNENRVGIAVYDTDASVLLPLDRYTTTSINNNGTNSNTNDDYPEYIELVNFDRGYWGNNTGQIRTVKTQTTKYETVTIDYSNVDWNALTDEVDKVGKNVTTNTYNKNVGAVLSKYLSSLIPAGVTVNWQNHSSNNRNKQNGQWRNNWKTYFTTNLKSVSGNITTTTYYVTNAEGNDVEKSVEIGGGTYMQAGMYQAWTQFGNVKDTVVQSGILAGTKRMPVMVLMTDGAPTYTTLEYNEVGNYNDDISDGSTENSANNRNGFLTQLTASWVKEKMAAHYNNGALFYTLGLGVGTSEIAQSVLNPDFSTEEIDGYWELFLPARNGATVRLNEERFDYTDVKKRDEIVKTKDYVNKYFGADDADGLINAFNEIVSEIVLQSKYYPTLAESKNYNMDGFMTFTDVIGEYMEVKDIKGLISGTGTARKLYSGSAFAKAFIRDNIFGNISTGNMNNLDDDGKDMIKVIQNRLGCTEDQAKEALRQAILQGHVSYTSDTNYSNYMCWFADASGKFVAVWNGDEDATFAGAKYRVTDYGFYGTVGSDATFNLTDMAYIVVQVLEDIATGQQTMVWKVPASLIPVIEYEVSFDGNSYENATNIKMNVVEAEPLRLVYEVGVHSDINEYNISEIVDPNYEFINSDKDYTFYTNLFNYDEVNKNKNTGADSDKATEMVFEPSLENERYYYTKDTYVLDTHGNKVKTITPGQKYNYETVHFNKKSDGTVDLIRWNSEISAEKLGEAVEDDDDYLYLPKGTAFNRLAAAGTTDKYAAGGIEANVTDSLGYFNYPVIYPADDYTSKTYLGNNGRVTIEPKTGIKLSKVIESVAANTNTSFDFVIDVKDETGAAITKELEVARFHKDGTAYDIYEVTPSNGKFTVTLLEGEHAYVMDLPEGAVYTVTEKYNEDYSLKIATVNGVTQSLNVPYDATGTTKNNVFDNVVFENALTVEGTLTVEKEVEYPFDVNAQVAANKEFTILVDLGAKYAGRNIELVGGKTVAANANGVVVVVLKDGESVTFVLDEGDGYVVTETNLPAGFTMNTTSSVNLSGSVTKDGITATVVNTYQPEKVNPVNVTVDGTKELTGRDWLVSDQFQYLLQSFDGSVWNTITVVNGDKDTVNKDDKTFNFNNTVGAIELTEVGTYYYRVIEVYGGNTISGVTYDNTVYNFNIVVTDADLDGKLEIADVTSPNATVTKENDTYGVSVSFTNTYAPSGNAEIVLNINKEITNNTSTTIGKDGYTFELYDNNGRLVATSDATTNEGNTSIELVFNVDSLGEHEYVLKEVIPTNPLTGMVYDSTIHNIVIKVFDNLDGTLATQVKVDNGNFVVSDNAEINFNNIYDEETHVITGNKVLIGREWQEGDSFSFRLYKTGADFDETATGAQLVDTQVVDFASATKDFTFDSVTYYETGSHYYVIKEVAGNIDAIRYDEQEYHVTVTLTRDANQQLVKEVTIVNGKGETVNNITFTNEYLIEATVVKVWDDANNQDGKRPTELTVTLSNGTQVTLNAENNWTATVKDLPVYSNGVKIEYTWTEENVDGYTLTNTSVNGTVTTLTNTHTPETTEATVLKVWDDANNQDGKRPSSLTVTLSNGTQVTLNEANGWTETVSNLPVYKDGQKIEYTWTEATVEGYTLTGSVTNGTVTTLTNTHTPETTEVSVKKVWDDANNQDGKRPSSLTVTLSNGTQETLNEANGWTETVTDLPKYKDGVVIVYSWTEANVEGYTLTGSVTNGTLTTLTNTHTPETTNVEGTKIWDDANNQDGKRPTSITVNLFANGEKVSSTEVKADNEGNWTYEFNNLPKYKEGKEINYTVTEDAVSGYTTTYDGYNIKNSYTPETTEATVLKVWDDANNQDGKRPLELKVTLSNGTQVTLNANNNWTATVENLPVYNNGVKIEYTWTETDVEGYTLTGSVTNGTVTTLTNTHTPETTEVSVKKVWDDANNQDGKRPSSLTVTLSNGTQVTLNANNDWTATVENLPVYKDGQKIEYTWTEANVEGYTLTGSTTDGTLTILTNTHTPEETTATVKKVWDDAENQDGKRPAELIVTLSNGTQVTLNADNRWTATVEDLPVYNNGVKIEYTWTETDVEGYTLTGSATNGTVTTLTNTHTPETTEVSVKKVWDDANNQDGKRPSSLTVTLSNGTQVTLNAENDWTATVKDLPVYADGEKIEYTWTEANVEGYTLSGSVTNGTLTTLTNTHTPEETTATVKKVWDDANNQDGKRPVELKVTLSNGTEVTLNADNRWTATVENLPVYKDGQLIEYTWAEATVDGYTLTGTVKDGTLTTLTNSYTPEKTTATVVKVWNDLNDKDGKRPTELTVTLSNGTQVTLNAENDWTATVENLDKYANGVVIEYRWTETSLPEGYELTNTSKNGTITTLTNTHVVPVDVEFTGNKILSGRDWLDTDSFAFALYKTESDFVVAANASAIDTQYATKENQAVTFDAISYDEVGTYHYVIKELAGNIGGITYDKAEYHVTVSVTSNENNQLVKSVNMVNVAGETVSTATFTNTYKAAPVTTSVLKGKKTLNGRDMKTGEFTFRLYETGSTFQVANDAVAKVTVQNDAASEGVADELEFTSFTFDKTGSYYYVVKEDLTPISGVTLDTSVFNIRIDVTDNEKGNLVAKVYVNGQENGAIAFVNTYTVNPTAFKINGTKVLTGRTLENGEFTFALYESDITFTNRTLVTKVENNAGAFEFTGLAKAVGTYYYVIEEEAGSKGGVTYDDTHYHVTVAVNDNGQGGTNAQITSIKKVIKDEQGTRVETATGIAFENSYAPKETTIEIGGNKVLDGRHTIDGEFTFELYEANKDYVITNNTPIRTVNDADTFMFEPVTLNAKGSYYYVVKELNRGAGGMKYDDASYYVEVLVTDDLKGQLHASIVSITNQEGKSLENITFNNKYVIEDPVSTIINGTKVFTGREWTKDDVFTFELYEANSNYEVANGAQALDTQTATKGNTAFVFDEIQYNAEATHYYVVKEVAGEANKGITYDSTVYEIKVEVVDNHNGAFKLTKTMTAKDTVVTEIKFTNTYKVFDNTAAYIAIEATKSLEGRPLKNGEFEFELYNATYDEATGKHIKTTLIETVKNNNTTVAFSEIKYEKTGTYYYVVKEKEGNLGGVSYDTKEYPVTVEVYDDGQGRLAINKYINGEAGSITINNTYTITPKDFVLSGNKVLEGRPLKADEFAFSLYEATDESYENRTLVETVKNAKDGKFTFSSLTKEVGKYYFVIEEEKGTLGGVEYDKAHYHVVVTIVDNGDGFTKVDSITYEKVDNGSTLPAQKVAFTNKYKATDKVGLVLDGIKKLDGRHTIDGEFTFELYETGSDYVIAPETKPIQTVNDDDKFAFEPLTYTAIGNKYYVIKELNKNIDNGMTYDSTSFKVHVEITDDLNGELVATVKSIENSLGNKVNNIQFNNKYEIKTPNSVVINGIKTLRGRDWLDTDVFTFELYEANSNYEVANGAQALDTQTATKGNTAFVFDEIQYNAEATHYYVVKEVAGNLGGITYDATVFNVKVVVTDNHDGTLSVEKTYFVGDSKVDAIEFVNSYKVLDSSKAYATIRGIKNLEGRALANNEFEFELYKATYDAETKQYVTGELKETVTNTATAFTFSTMEYNEVGTHYYVVKEKVGELGGIKYDETLYVIEVKITDGYDGKLYSSVAIINSDATVVEFNNTYTIYPDTFSFEAVKTLTGREMNAGEFSFELYETNSSYENAKLVQTVKNDKAGKVEFAGLSKYPGTYYYVIKEVEGTKGGVSYDSSYYQVKIVIVDEGNGTTKIENTTITKVSITPEGATTSNPNEVTFTNNYEAHDSTGIDIRGTKELAGRHMINGEFTFELYDQTGKLVQSVENKDGGFVFTDVKFEAAGTYTYTVKEKALGAGGMSYDPTVYEVVIEVTDNLNGELEAKVVSINGSENGTITFKNTYVIEYPTSTTISGIKTFTGREWTNDDVFTFELYETGENHVVAEGQKAIDTQYATKENKAFTFDVIEYKEEKTHYYVVKEVAGASNEGITYDTSVYNITVEVKDEHNGKLSLTQTVTKAGTTVEEIKFVNTYKIYEGAFAQATISGIKTLTTRPIKDAEFTFDLYSTGQDYVIPAGQEPIQTVNDGVSFTFEPIKYDKIGTYYYVVKEMNAGETLNGVTYDAREHQLYVTVYDGGKGYLESTITVVNSNDNTLEVNNTYTITPTEFKLDGTKELSGREMNAGEFEFELYQANNRFVETELIQTVTNAKDGSFEFTGLKQQPGTYYYVIKEKAGSKGGVTYDTAKYQVTVTVKDDERGGTLVERKEYVKVTNDGSEVSQNVVFENTYEAKDSDGIVIEGTKVLDGRNLVNGEFIFELLDKDGVVLLQTTVNKDGEFEFDAVKYETTGTYTYTVREKDNGIGGVTYDSTIYKVVVEVTDDLNGELDAEIISIKDVNNKSYESMVFNNTYKAKPIDYIIEGIKVVDGREWLDTDVFTFELYETGSDYAVAEDAEALDTQQATKDAQEFTFETITYEKTDTYYYVVKEVVGTIGGITYDVTTYNIEVLVKDMLDGTFEITDKVVVNGELKETIIFTNPYKALPNKEGEGVIISAEKTLTGRDMNEGEFTFDLYQTEGDFVVNAEAIQSKTNAADGKVVFDEILYDEAGTYYYVVLEKAGTKGGVTYDTTAYNITVTVTDNLEGKLVTNIESIEINEEAVDEITFNNEYAPAPTVDGIKLEALKTLNGRQLKDGQFTFSLYEANEEFEITTASLQTKENDVEGNVIFDELQYEEVGTYYYVVKEDIGNSKNIIYDESEYHITVEVTDDLEGQLHAEVVSIVKGEEEVETIVFENTYFVDTADESTPYGWLTTMLMSALGLVFILKERKRNN